MVHVSFPTKALQLGDLARRGSRARTQEPAITPTETSTADQDKSQCRQEPPCLTSRCHLRQSDRQEPPRSENRVQRKHHVIPLSEFTRGTLRTKESGMEERRRDESLLQTL